MPAHCRYEYHWIENRVVERHVRRPVGVKRWPFSLTAPTLIAIVEPRDNSFELRRGPGATDQRVVDAVRHYEHLYADVTIPDLGAKIPRSLAKRASFAVTRLVGEYAPQFTSFAHEEDITGFVKGRVHDTVIEEGNWRIAVRSWTYARLPKERDLGVDVGVIVDIILDDHRVIKAIWLQAKRCEELPADILNFEDLKEQLEKMQRHTSEAYALIYTPDGPHVFHAKSTNDPLTVDTVIFDSIVCERGDRDPIVIALTGDSKVVLTLFVTG